MPALIVIGCIVLLFVILFAAHAYVTIDLKDEMALTIRFLGIPIRILPAKPKKYNLKKYTLKKIRKRDEAAAKKAAKKKEAKIKKKAAADKKKAEKAAELAKLSKEELAARKAAKKAKQPAVTDLIPLVARVAGLFFSRFFGKLRIKVARLHITVGAADAMTAAIMFAGIHEGLRYLLRVLAKITNVDGLKKADVSVDADFLSSDIKFDCKLTLRVSLGNILGAVFKAGWAFLVGFIKIKPDPNHPKNSLFPTLPELPDLPDLPDFFGSAAKPAEDTAETGDPAAEPAPEAAPAVSA